MVYSILEKRQHNEEVLKLLSILRYQNKPIELVGSASLKSQRYFSDYDFFSIIGAQHFLEAFANFNAILNKVNLNPNYYPVELKLQLKNGRKVKYYPPIEIDLKKFKAVYKNIDFVKLDLVIYENFRFIEVSIIYKIFDASQFTSEQYKRDLEKDILLYAKERNYYKALKRLFNVYRADNNKEGLTILTKFFNSAVGEKYQLKSNLEAIQLVRRAYPKDAQVDEKIKVNLKKLQPYTLLDYKRIKKLVNDKARELFKKLV